MIGGTSYFSTLEYYRLINEEVGNRIGKEFNPELILHSISIEVMRKQIKEDIEAKYLEVSRKLQLAGADAIVICEWPNVAQPLADLYVTLDHPVKGPAIKQFIHSLWNHPGSMRLYRFETLSTLFGNAVIDPRLQFFNCRYANA